MSLESRLARLEQQQPGMSPTGAEGAGLNGEVRGKHKAEGVNEPPANGGAQTQGGQPGERKHEGKGKGAAASATPGPQ